MFVGRHARGRKDGGIPPPIHPAIPYSHNVYFRRWDSIKQEAKAKCLICKDMARKYRESITRVGSGNYSNDNLINPAIKLKTFFFIYGEEDSFTINMHIEGIQSGKYEVYKIGNKSQSFISRVAALLWITKKTSIPF
jgi:hypothetical protein